MKVPRRQGRGTLEFNPQATAQIPLSVGSSGFAAGAARASEAALGVYTQKQQAEEEVALGRLQENLNNSALEAEQDLNANASDIPFGDFRSHAEAKNQENIQKYISSDPVLQRLSIAGQARFDKALISSHGTVGRNAERQSAFAMAKELEGKQSIREERVIQNVNSDPLGVVHAMEGVENFYKELDKACSSSVICVPSELAQSAIAGVRRSQELGLNRVIDELSNSIAGTGEFTAHPDIKTALDVPAAIKRGDFKMLYGENSEAEFIRKTTAAIVTATNTKRTQVELSNRAKAYGDMQGVFHDAKDPAKAHLVTPERVLKISKKIFKAGLSNPAPLLNFLSKLQFDTTKPTATQEEAYYHANNALRNVAVQAKFEGRPVTVADLAGVYKNVDPNEIHPSQFAKLLTGAESLLDNANRDIETVISDIQADIASSLGKKAIKPGDIKGTLLQALSPSGNAEFPKLVGDLPGVIGTAVESLVRNTLKDNPGKQINKSEIIQEVYDNILKGKVGHPTTINIPTDTLRDAYYHKERGHKLTPSSQFVLDLDAAKQGRLGNISLRLMPIKQLMQSNKAKHMPALDGLSPTDRDFYEAYVKHIGPHHQKNLIARNDAIAQAQQENAEDERRSDLAKRKVKAFTEPSPVVSPPLSFTDNDLMKMLDEPSEGDSALLGSEGGSSLSAIPATPAVDSGAKLEEAPDVQSLTPDLLNKSESELKDIVNGIISIASGKFQASVRPGMEDAKRLVDVYGGEMKSDADIMQLLKKLGLDHLIEDSKDE